LLLCRRAFASELLCLHIPYLRSTARCVLIDCQVFPGDASVLSSLVEMLVQELTTRLPDWVNNFAAGKGPFSLPLFWCAFARALVPSSGVALASWLILKALPCVRLLRAGFGPCQP
jgi:hypothetical protein